jgi:hypothetical protein
MYRHPSGGLGEGGARISQKQEQKYLNSGSEVSNELNNQVFRSHACCLPRHE